jgi:hypothetical protein
MNNQNETVTAAEPEEYLSEISQMIYGNWVSQVACVFAELGIADRLTAGGKDIGQLAEFAKVKKDYLKRFMRCATELGLVIFDSSSGLYNVTAKGELLGSDHPQSKREEARLNGAGYRYQPWGHLADILKNGMNEAYSPTGIDGSLDFLKDKPVQRKTFHKAMTERSRVENDLVLRNFSFAGFSRLLDIGCGEGSFIKAILDKEPHLQGCMFDLQETFDDDTKGKYRGRLIQKRGDFFAEISDWADVYTMKSVIHNWPEHKALKIMESVRNAMASQKSNPAKPSEKRLFIIENILPDGDEKSIANWLDLNFMVTIDGAERTLEEYRLLGKKAGLKLLGTTPTPSGRHMIEFCLLQETA